MSLESLISKYGDSLEYRVEEESVDDYGDPVYGALSPWTAFTGRILKSVKQSTTNSDVDEIDSFTNKVVTTVFFDEDKKYQFRESGQDKIYTVKQVQRSTDTSKKKYYYLIF